MIKELSKCIREYKKPTLWTLFFIVLEVIIEIFIPFITAQLVNGIKNNIPTQQVVAIGAFLAVMACFSLICGGMASFTCSKASAGFAKNLRHDMFDKIQTYSFENIDKFSSSSLVTRMTTDVANVQMSYMMLIRTAVRSPLMLTFAVIMAYIMGGALAATFVVVVPLLAIGLFAVIHFAMPAFRRVFKKYDRLNETIEENVRGMRVVKGFAREDYEKKKFTIASDDIRRDFTKAERLVALNAPLMQFCVYFNMIFVLTVGSKMVITGRGQTIDVGQLSAMLTYGMQILISLMMLSMIYVILAMSAESAKRILEVLSETPTLASPPKAVMAVSDGSIVFENVSFKYANTAKNYALERINLTIQSGITVGIIGGTGTGKSTLVQLIPRLYDVTEGRLLVGGRDVRDYDLEALRQAVAMVLQKNVLFSGTIKDNLRWGNPEATDEEIKKACLLSQSQEFIETFPKGYDTWVEQGGSNLSGGQRQRLCIARALLKQPKILILDDSTSAVDMKTDARIQEGFNSYIPKTTKIIIAQRVASVMEADLIVVMDDGRIEATGTHEELLSKSTIYREVYEQQVNGGDDSEKK